MSKDETLKAVKDLQNEHTAQKKTDKDLVDLLYGGEKISKASDIVQSTYDNLDYILEDYVISDCYLLVNLISLAKKDPKEITQLIKPKNNNEVSVRFYEAMVETINDSGDTCEVSFKATSKTKEYSVTKDEALNWKTCHKVLWPVVMEIAYAKHLEFTFKDKIFVQNLLPILGTDVTGRKIEEAYKGDFRHLLGELVSALTMVHLLGGKSAEKRYKKANNIKKFSEKGKYNTESEAMYNLIMKKLGQSKIINVSFRDGNKANKNDAKKHGLTVISLADSFIKNPENLKGKIVFHQGKEKVAKWLTTNKISNLDKLCTNKNKDKLLNFIVDLWPKYTVTSKTQRGIITGHSYLITDAFEYEGYKIYNH